MKNSFCKVLIGLCALGSIGATAGLAGAAKATVTPLPVNPALNLVDSVTTDGTNHYLGIYTTCPPNACGIIRFMPLGGGHLDMLFDEWGVSGSRAVHAITSTDSDLFWADSNSGADTGSQILRASKKGAPITAIFSGDEIRDASGIATDGASIFVADMVGGRAFRMNQDGSGLTQLGNERYPAFFSHEHFNSIAVHDGTVYVADAGKDWVNEPQVAAIPADGDIGSEWTPLHVGAPLISPGGIAIGEGRVFIAEAVTNIIWSMPLSGGTPTVYAQDERFQRLAGMTYFDGALYVTDMGGAGALWKITPTPRPAIRMSPVEICWASRADETYVVQHCSSLASNCWADLTAPIQGSGTTNCVTDAVPLGEPQRYYRVLVAP